MTIVNNIGKTVYCKQYCTALVWIICIYIFFKKKEENWKFCRFLQNGFLWLLFIVQIFHKNRKHWATSTASAIAVSTTVCLHKVEITWILKNSKIILKISIFSKLRDTTLNKAIEENFQVKFLKNLIQVEDEVNQFSAYDNIFSKMISLYQEYNEKSSIKIDFFDFQLNMPMKK